MSATTQLFVKSHVARDLLQNAGLFKTDKLVVWEYVANGLQYTNPGTNPVVRATLAWISTDNSLPKNSPCFWSAPLAGVMLGTVVGLSI